MAPDKSTGSGLPGAEVSAASTAAPKAPSKPKGSKPTGAGSKKPKGPSRADTLLIYTSAMIQMSRWVGTIDVANGTSDTMYVRLPKSLHICQEPGCLRLFQTPEPDSLYCDLHRAAHSTKAVEQIQDAITVLTPPLENHKLPEV